MNIEEAHERIITGPERFNRGAVDSIQFAVFVDKESDVRIMHITEKRSEILNRDLRKQGCVFYREYVATYNCFVTLKEMQEDVAFVAAQHEVRRKSNGQLH